MDDRKKYIGGSDACRIIAGDWLNLWKEKTGGESEAITLEEAKSIEKKFANSCFAFKKDGEVYNEYKEILIGKVKNN